MKNYIGKTYHVVTYGCQMNVHESEKIRGILSTFGMNEIDDVEKADVVVFNTCCIREGAEDRAYNNIMALKKIKLANPNKVIVMCGCMPQQKEGKYKLKQKLNFVDIIIGTHNINMLGEYLIRISEDKKRIYEIIDKPTKSMDFDGSIRDDKVNAYVNIIYGCNKFCTYCIVPYVRGREYSRPMEDIYKEVNGEKLDILNVEASGGYLYVSYSGFYRKYKIADLETIEENMLYDFQVEPILKKYGRKE